jgi:hypothetical protein
MIDAQYDFIIALKNTYFIIEPENKQNSSLLFNKIT